jgi:hypothetical protein
MAVILGLIIIPYAEFATTNVYDIECDEVLKSIPNFFIYINKAGPGGVMVIITQSVIIDPRILLTAT